METLMNKYKIAVSEGYVELITVEAENEGDAIEEALMQSSFLQPELEELQTLEKGKDS